MRPEAALLILRLIVPLILYLASVTGAQAACGLIPADFVAASGSGGLKLGNNLLVNGNLAEGQNTGSNFELNPDGSLTRNPLSLPELAPDDFPANGSRDDLQVGDGDDLTLDNAATRFYDDIRVRSDAVLRLTGGGEVHIDDLVLDSGARLVLDPGTYYVDSLELGEDAVIDTNGGPVILRIGTDLDAAGRARINAGGNVTDLRVMLSRNADVNIGRDSQVTALIYGPEAGHVELQDNVSLHGAVVSGGRITLGDGVTAILTPADQAAIARISSCNLDAPLSAWRFDECDYDNRVGEALDSQATAHATPYGNVDTAETGILGRHLDLRNQSHHLRTAVTLPANWTLSTWLRTPFTSNHRYHVLAAVEGGGDLMFIDRDNAWRWGVYRPGSIRYGSFRFSSLADGWHHLALVGEGGSTRLYIDGADVGSVSQQVTGVLTYIGTSYDEVGTANAQGMGAALDELLLFDLALTQAGIDGIRQLQGGGLDYDGSPRAPVICQALASLLVQPASLAASTCQPLTVSIQALDQNNQPLIGYTGNLSIETHSGHGDWQRLDATNPLNSGAADSGLADYAFAGDDLGAITLGLANLHAETTQIRVTDSATGISAESAPVTFAENALIISSVDSFDDPVAGRDHSLVVEYFSREAASPPLPGVPAAPCSRVTDYAGSKLLKAWYNPAATHPAGAAAPRLAGATEVTLTTTPPASANLTLDFVAGRATTTLRTRDVGRYSLALLDDSLGFADVPVAGATATMTTRPLGLKVTTLAALPAPPNTTPDAAVFANAGADFAIDVSAVLWQDASDDLDADGNPVDPDDLLDNTALAPSFAAEVSLAAELQTPALGVVGVLDRSGGALPLTAAAFTNGNARISDLRYSEVGSMRIRATSSAFLGSSGSLSGLSAPIGRFKPDHFELALANAPSWQAACLTYTYLGQGFDYDVQPEVLLTAHNARHGVTRNYQDFTSLGGDDWWRVADADLSLALSDMAAPAGILLQTTAAAGFTTIETPVSGGQVRFRLQGPMQHVIPGPAGHTAGAGHPPFSATVRATLSYSGVDGEDEGDLVIAPGATLGAGQVLHGRLRMDNAYGSERVNFDLPLMLERFDGSVWRTADTDTCTPALQPGDFLYQPADRPADQSTPFVGGRARLTYLCAGGGCAPGNVDLRADLSGATGPAPGLPWLRYDWDGDGIVQDPAARAAFGVYRGNEKQIYLREMY